MRHISVIFGLIILGCGAGCLEKSSTNAGTAATVIYRHHFLGAAHLRQGTNYGALAPVFALPASRELGEQSLQKLSKAPQELWQKFLPAGASSQPAQFRPLLDDLVSAESYAEVRGPLKRGESIFAIELNDERAGLWRTNLANIFTAWKLGKPTPVTVSAAKGWELRRTESPGVIQFLRAGKWVLVGLGTERLTLLPDLLERINKDGRPMAAQPNAALEIEADCPRLVDWLPSLGISKLPPIHLTIAGKGAYLRSEIQLHYSQPVPWVPEPWRIPTNLISDPIISFTAARGIAPLLSQVKGISALDVPLPNQLCAWGPATIHAETFVSVPMANPTNVLERIGPKLPDFTAGLLSRNVGGFVLTSNRNELVWAGWPVLVPHVRVMHDGGADYLVGSLLPTRILTNRLPPELFSQLKNGTNQVYYDWEITQSRLVHSKQLHQLWDIFNQRRMAPTNSVEQSWLLAIAPYLGNTITEATLTSPKELTIVRRSDLGFTGFELSTLARWLASSGFPLKFESPLPMSTRTNFATPRSNPPPPGVRKQ